MLKVKIGDLADAIKPLIKVDIPVLVRGWTGIGKSEIAASQIVPWIESEFGSCVLHDIRLSTKDVVDGTGMPIIDQQERATYWTRPAFIPQDDGRMHLFLMDEVGHAQVPLQHLLYQFVRERRLGEYHLPKNNRIVLMTNTREDKGGDNKLLVPLEGRMAHVLAELDVKGWMEHGKRKGFDARVLAFIDRRPQLLHFLANRSNENQKGGDVADGPARYMPRTIEDVAKVMKLFGGDEKVVNAASIASCGEGFAAEFGQFRKDLAADLPRLVDIKTNPTKVKVPSNIQHQRVIAQAIAEVMTKDDVDTWTKYLRRIEGDLAAATAHQAMSAKPELRDNKALKELIL